MLRDLLVLLLNTANLKKLNKLAKKMANLQSIINLKPFYSVCLIVSLAASLNKIAD